MLASIAGPEERTAGRAARIRPRTAGNERFRAPSAGIAALQRARQLADGGRELLLARGEGAGGRVEVGDERLELLAVAVDRLGGGAGLVDVAPEVAGLRALRRVGDDRAVAVGGLPVGDRRGCSRARPRPSGPRSSSRSSAWRSLRVGACRALRTWSSCTGALVWLIGRRSPSCSCRRRGRAGADVDEEVALEEDARADLHRRVPVERQALLVDPHGHERGLLAVLDVADRR